MGSERKATDLQSLSSTRTEVGVLLQAQLNKGVEAV